MVGAEGFQPSPPPNRAHRHHLRHPIEVVVIPALHQHRPPLRRPSCTPRRSREGTRDSAGAGAECRERQGRTGAERRAAQREGGAEGEGRPRRWIFATAVGSERESEREGRPRERERESCERGGDWFREGERDVRLGEVSRGAWTEIESGLRIETRPRDWVSCSTLRLVGHLGLGG